MRHLRTPLATVAFIMAAPALAIGSFSADEFKFVVIVKEGSTRAPGGWQQATTTLRFVDGRQDPARLWTCKVTVGMPLRTKAEGPISPEVAATRTADIATMVSTVVMHSRPSWFQAEFCGVFKEQMQAAFDQVHEGLGARVNSP